MRLGIDAIDSKLKHAKHVSRVEAKYQTLQGKEAILEMWESGKYQFDHEYILGLRKRVRMIRNNLLAMRPMKDES